MKKLDHRKTYIRKRRRDTAGTERLASRRNGERMSDISAACTVWLIKRCPGYADEVRNCYRGVTFGSKAKP